MKLISFLFLLSTAMGIFQSFYGVKTLRDVPPASNDRKYKNVYKLSETYLQEHGLYNVTLNDKFINMSLLQKKHLSSAEFDRLFTDNAYMSVTNYYLSHCCPFDTIIGSFEEDRKLEERIAASNASSTVAGGDTYDTTLIQVKRGDFWNSIFTINKEYANPVGFTNIEKAIIEAHEAVGLDWNDTIFIPNDAIEKHKAAVEHIFTDLKDEVNKIYLK